MNMFILRGCNYLPNPTNKPEGMMVRPDGWWTDNKKAVKLFDTIAEAEHFYVNTCLPLWRTNNTHTTIVYIVETTIKPVPDKISKTATKQLQ